MIYCAALLAQFHLDKCGESSLQVYGVSYIDYSRRAAKARCKMISSELCAGNLFAALDFAKRMNYTGPWICAGDGTKVRLLLI